MHYRKRSRGVQRARQRLSHPALGGVANGFSYLPFYSLPSSAKFDTGALRKCQAVKSHKPNNQGHTPADGCFSPD
jgi:hypothetical protein